MLKKWYSLDQILHDITLQSHECGEEREGQRNRDEDSGQSGNVRRIIYFQVVDSINNLGVDIRSSTGIRRMRIHDIYPWNEQRSTKIHLSINSVSRESE